MYQCREARKKDVCVAAFNWHKLFFFSFYFQLKLHWWNLAVDKYICKPVQEGVDFLFCACLCLHLFLSSLFVRLWLFLSLCLSFAFSLSPYTYTNTNKHSCHSGLLLRASESLQMGTAKCRCHSASAPTKQGHLLCAQVTTGHFHTRIPRITNTN